MSARLACIAARALATCSMLLSHATDLIGPELQPVWDLLQKLLRSDALHAACGQLAAAAAPLLVATGTVAALGEGPPAHATQPQHRHQDRQPQQPQQPQYPVGAAHISPFLFRHALHLLIFVCSLVNTCILIAGGAEQAPCLESQEVWTPAARALGRELVTALAGSSVLEHAARIALLLAPLPPSGHSFGPYDRACWRDALLLTSAACFNAARLAEEYPDGAAAAAGFGGNGGNGGGGDGGDAVASLLYDTLRGRCVRHAALSIGIALLAAADGGPAYGMPPPLLAALPTGLLYGTPEGTDPAVGRRPAYCLRAMMKLLGVRNQGFHVGQGPEAGAAQRTAPGLPGRRVSLALVLRVGWLAAASARAHDGAAATTAAEAADRRDGGSTSSAAGGGRAGAAGSPSGGGSGGCAGGSALGATSLVHSLYSGPDARLYDVGPRWMYMEQDAIVITAMEALEVAWELLRTPRPLLRAQRPSPLTAAVAATAAVEEATQDAAAAAGGGAGVGAQATAGAAVAATAAAGGSSGSAATAVAEAAEWWRLLVVMARHASLCAADGQLPRLVQYLKRSVASGSEFEGEPGALRPAPEPRPLTAAALAGGLLPCLERLLRRAGRDPAGPEAEVMRRIVRPDVWGNWLYLAPLLAYGDPRQAASLLATTAKLLRVMGPWAGLPGSVQGQLMECVVNLVASLLTPAVAEANAAERGARTREVTARAAEAAEAEPPHAAARQLTAMVSYAASEWLPALAAVALDKAQDAAARAARAAAVSGVAERNRRPCAPNLQPFLAALTPLLPWLPILAARCGAPTRRHQGGGGGSAGAPGCQAGAGTGTAATAAANMPAPTGANDAGDGAERAAGAGGNGGDGSWASLLLHDMDAVRLLGAVLEFVPYYPQPDSGVSPELLPAYLRRMVAGCRAVAEVAPRVEPSGGETGGEGTAAAAEPPLWRPELVRLVGAQLRVMCEFEWAAAAEVLATELEEGRGGGRSGGGVSGRAEGAGRGARRGRQGLEEVGRGSGAAAAALGSPHSPPFLLPPSEARRLLRTCTNPQCVNLGGDSEAELTLRGCAGCGGTAAYCSRDCQTQHWRAGHREACGQRARGGGGGQGANEFRAPDL